MKPYASHLGLLGLCVALNKGDILEIGGGYFSTPFLHYSCDKNILTLEEAEDFYTDLNKRFSSENHGIKHMVNLESVKFLINKPWGLVFIDNELPYDCVKELEETGDIKYEGRKKCIRFLADKCDMMLVHDTEQASFAGDEELWLSFKYVYTFKPDGLPHTTYCSNKIDLLSYLSKMKK